MKEIKPVPNNTETINRIKERTTKYKQIYDPYEGYADPKANTIVDLLFIVDYLLDELDNQ